MKRMVLLIGILSLSISLFAAQPKNVEQSLRLSVTTTNTVYFGVSKKEQTSSIFPKDSVIPYETGLGFKYNAKTMNWETDSVYFFLLSFVQDRIKMTITPPGPLTSSNDPLTSSNGTDSVAWRNESADITGLSSKSTNPITIVDESSWALNDGRLGGPRVYSLEMKLVIDGSSTLKSNSYSGNIKVKVEALT